MADRPLSVILEDAFTRCRDLEAPLADRLQAFAEEVRRMGPQFQTTVDSFVERLMETGAGKTAPKVGEKMPPFMLPDEHGRLVSLDELLEGGPVAIAFHRGYWCPYCRINVNALARAEKEIAAERRHIAAIMPDRQKFTAWLKSDAEAPFPILTDMDNGYAMSLNLAVWVGEEMKEMMVNAGWDPSVSQGTNDWALPIPATFVVGTEGTVTARFVDPDYRMRMAIEDMVGALRSAN
jgi:peroxiredoxin